MSSTETRKPSHRLIRYYGKGANAARSEIGAIWSNEDGSMSIRLDTLETQIWLNAFPVEGQSGSSEV